MLTTETTHGTLPALASDMSPVTPALLRDLARRLGPPNGKDSAESELRTIIQALEGAAVLVEQRHELYAAALPFTEPDRELEVAQRGYVILRVTPADMDELRLAVMEARDGRQG